jgi:hypothetical protein
VADKIPTKKIDFFLIKFFGSILFEGTFTSAFKEKSQNEVTKN